MNNEFKMPEPVGSVYHLAVPLLKGERTHLNPADFADNDPSYLRLYTADNMRSVIEQCVDLVNASESAGEAMREIHKLLEQVK